MKKMTIICNNSLYNNKIKNENYNYKFLKFIFDIKIKIIKKILKLLYINY